MKEGPFSNFKYFPFFDTKLSSYRNIINFLLIIIFFISVSFLNVSAQVGKSFFTVHCDPPHSPNWSYLVEIVDSANAYNIPLTIMLTPPWADSVYSNSSKANQLALWQSQGHEIGAHHHGLSAANPLTWDGYTNASNIEIAQAGLDSLDKIGDMDDFLAYMRPIAGSETLTTGGIAEEYDWPSGLIYRAEGLNYDHTDVFSTISVYNHNGFQVCGLTYANVNNTSVNYAMAQFNNYGNNYCTGLITHANNFSNNMLKRAATLQWFNFISDSIQTSTIRDIMNDAACTVTPIRQIKENYISDKIRMYPNPFSGSTNLTIKVDHSGSIDLFLFSISGQLVRQYKQITGDNSNNFQIYLDDIDRGVYMFKVVTKNHMFVKKLIVN